MAIANFHITACPKGQADQDDIDPGSPTGFRLTPEQQLQLDQASRLLEEQDQILGILEAVAMHSGYMSTEAIEILDYLRHGSGVEEAAE